MTREEALEILTNHTQYKCADYDLVALKMAIDALQTLDKIQRAYENILLDYETKGDSEYLRGATDMWEIVRGEMEL